MATNTSLLARIKRMEQIIGPEILAVPFDRRKVIQVNDNEWSVCSITFEVEKEAIDFSNKLKDQGLTAYLDEIINQLEGFRDGDYSSNKK
ncbi:hypothetical protein ACQUD9_06665 [Vagococcus fluvialis]|uniref:hypothetical protein n=1 Tax=Vagococcus fluvialis TaxID=2738 RepID=UPI003D0E7AD7